MTEIELTVAEGTLCARLAPFAICADARATFTDARVLPDEPASKVRSVYGGLLLGFTREGRSGDGLPENARATGERPRSGEVESRYHRR